MRVGRVLAVTAAELLDLVLPRPCPGCGGVGPWCAGCAGTLTAAPREPVLGDAALSALTASGHPLPVIRSLARYSGPAREAIIAGKEHGRRDLPPLLGRALGAGLLRLQRSAVLPTGPCLVPAPTKASAARARGGDPVLAMARAAAALLAGAGQPTSVAGCLRTAGTARDSARLTADERTANLAGRVRVRPAALPPAGRPVVLIDDVLTSGATAAAAVAVLWRAGTPVHAVVTVAAVPPWRSAR